jgi:hypothetical protein
MPYKIPSAAMLALSISALLSCWMLFGQPSVNTDGVIYLNAAQAFLDKGFAASLDVYNWPFYSILIALVSKLGVPLIQSAALLNILFFSALAWAFVTATALLYPRRHALHYLAAAIILFEPYINSLRGSFFRDNGQLPCMLLSLVALLHYLAKPRALTLLAWALATVVAALFRPESALLLAGGAAALSFNSKHKKTTVLMLTLILVSAAFSVLWLQQHAPTSRVRDLTTWTNYYLLDFRSTFAAKAETLEKAVLGDFSSNGSEALLASMVVTLIASVISVLTPFHAIVLWLQRRLDSGMDAAQRRALVAHLLAAAIPPIIFVAYAYFVSDRYLLAVALLLLLLLPPRLVAAIACIRSRPLRIGVIVALALFFGVSSYRNLQIETELKDAGIWLAGQPGSVWTNSLPTAYYIQTDDSTRTVLMQYRPSPTDIDQIQTDWVALVVAKRDQSTIPHLIEQLHGTEAKRFEARGRYVIVIKR